MDKDTIIYANRVGSGEDMELAKKLGIMAKPGEYGVFPDGSIGYMRKRDVRDLSRGQKTKLLSTIL